MPDAERRLVHVLFVDLVGFTPLVEGLDPEAVAALQDHYFGHVHAVATRYGGRVEKYVGDAVLVVFGLPALRDGDAERAVLAGLDIIDGMDDVAGDLALDAGALQVRVGIDTGDVIVRWGPEPGDWRVSGDVVNTAARLQAAADPGAVLVGEHVALAVDGRVPLRAGGPILLKGKSRPIPVWSAVPGLGNAVDVPSVRAPTPFVGRDAELAELERDCASGVRQVVVIAPPGTGKSRLVNEFAREVRERGGTVLIAAVLEDGAPYEPVATLLRAALGRPFSPAELTGELERTGSTGPRAELAARHVAALLEGGGEGAPEELWASWLAVLDGGDTPADVWIVEDAHLAAPDFHAFLRFACTAGRRPGRTVVATGRPGAWLPEGPDPTTGVVVRALGPLTDEQVETLVRETHRHAVIPDDLLRRIVASAGGNPLFVHEFLRDRELTGGLARTGNETVPSTIRSIHLAQLDLLSAETRELLAAGSVAGTTFPASALPALGIARPTGALALLTVTGLLHGPTPGPLDDSSYSYRHALVRDAAYTTLPRARRAELHVAFAEWAAGRGPSPRADVVGSHLEAALQEALELGGPVHAGLARTELARRAGRWLEDAGEASIGAAPQRAAELFGRARDLAPVGVSPDRARRQERHADALRRAGRLEEAIKAFEAVEEMVPSDDRVHRARAALGYEDALFDSRLPREDWGDRSLGLLAQALGVADRADHAGRSRLLAATARAHAYAGDRNRARSAGATAHELARRSGDPGALAYCLLARRANLIGPEDLERRLADGDELIESARAAGDGHLELEGARLRFVDLLEAGSIDEAERMRGRAERLAVELRRPAYLWYPSMWRAMMSLLRGDLLVAADLIADFRDEGVRWHYRDVELVHAVQSLQWHTEHGTVEQILPELETVAGHAPPAFRSVLVGAFARAGHIERVRRELAELRSDAYAHVAVDQSRSYSLCLLAEGIDLLADEADDVAADARELFAALTPWAKQGVVLGSGAVHLGAASHYLGLLARVGGDLAAATEHMADALTRNLAWGAERAAARSRQEAERTRRLVGA
ncbi:hypothetical protein Acsp06_26050 [Actinomycetospora sp. NBRC 106375]|uniref:adenylate/guanylate cyclase domain-containing protein n=1 Tax=Actinomycetospora sp. NBRC 106375 TaxID=3032207 RepID=UPI0024A5DF35|nr:adenylate/guanylate cyclase domain-containing protein [Actinomycetospora sp. NBRC 106375]GLZ46420.1 hypothetical protein Acsp06_26050 [Actinomycetospora sp. NBRC 106375]